MPIIETVQFIHCKLFLTLTELPMSLINTQVQDFKNEAAEILVNILDGKEHDSSQEFLRS